MDCRGVVSAGDSGGVEGGCGGRLTPSSTHVSHARDQQAPPALTELVGYIVNVCGDADGLVRRYQLPFTATEAIVTSSQLAAALAASSSTASGDHGAAGLDALFTFVTPQQRGAAQVTQAAAQAAAAQDGGDGGGGDPAAAPPAPPVAAAAAATGTAAAAAAAGGVAEAPLDALLSGYFAKVVLHLLHTQRKALTRYFEEQPHVWRHVLGGVAAFSLKELVSASRD
jgi:hypothetical protein